MHRFWHAFIEPLLVRLQPDLIVEIGCGEGANTKNLLAFCRATSAVLHAIDPAPEFDVAGCEETFRGHFVFHRAKSLDVLSKTGPADAVLIDGDHNWFTVFHELLLLEDIAQESDAAYPLVILHDVGWPYARRDLYYRPDDVPALYRQPFEERGMAPDSRRLLPTGGLNSGMCNAELEGGPKNGVLTAVEDFLGATEQDIEFVQVPGYHGLAVLAPSSRTSNSPSLRRFVRKLASADVLGPHLSSLEVARVQAEISIIGFEETVRTHDRELAERDAVIERHAGEAAARGAHIEQLSAHLAARDERLVAQNETLAARDAAIKQASAELAARDQALNELRARAELLERTMAAKQRRQWSRWRSISQFTSWVVVRPSRERLGFARMYFKLRGSGAFDQHFYLARYPDVAAAGLDPLMHFVEHGTREGRAPTPPGDKAARGEKKHSPGLLVVRSATPPSDAPNLRRGQSWRSLSQLGSWIFRRPRRPLVFLRRYVELKRSGDFDPRFYLSRYPDVAAAGLNPLMHYVEHGEREGRQSRARLDGDEPETVIQTDITTSVAPGRRLSVQRSSAVGEVWAARTRTTRNLVIYTAIANCYDTLKVPDVTLDPFDLICFCDEWDEERVPGWDLRPFDRFHVDPTRRARYVKLHPHIYFPDYEWSIWIDASILIRGDLVPLVEHVSRQGCLGMFPHPERDDVFEEAEAIIARGGLDDDAVVAEQIEKYRRAHVPPASGLWETGVLIRRHRDNSVVALMNAWWAEMENGSRRDQLSLPVVARRLGVSIVPLAPKGESVRTSELFTKFQHRSTAALA